MTAIRSIVPSALALVLGACASGDNERPQASLTGADTNGSSETTLDPDDSGSESPGEGDTGKTTGTDGSESGFEDSESGEGPGVSQCDVFAQDCPDGQKCMPYADDGGNAWNATRCSPVVATPGQAGDSCLVESSGVSGSDDCDVGLMCYNVDASTNQGTCYEVCSGSPAAPACSTSDAVCAIYNDGVLPLCFTACDPLRQDCPGTELCVASPNNNAFVCILDALPNATGTYGEPCNFANACDPGLFCAGTAAVPGCTNGGGCCSEFCDLQAADPSASCSGVSEGQRCLPWWTDAAPPGYEGVGFCGTPS